MRTMQWHRDSALIDKLGGTGETAKLCRVRTQAVSQWRRNGIPAARRMYLQVIRPEVFATEMVGHDLQAPEPASAA